MLSNLFNVNTKRPSNAPRPSRRSCPPSERDIIPITRIWLFWRLLGGGSIMPDYHILRGRIIRRRRKRRGRKKGVMKGIRRKRKTC
jgi:hypothetical protein